MIKMWHSWEKWECYKAGMYTPLKYLNITKEQGKCIYRDFLRDLNMFEDVLDKVINEWKYSCEMFLTEKSRNKIAWLGQASVCYKHRVPIYCRGGFKLLTEIEKINADKLAEKYLNIWISKYA